MNCFQQLTSKCSSQLTLFGSGQGWTLQRKPRVGPSPAGLFAGRFPSRDSCQFPAPTAGKGPVSLHCPWDIYCLVTQLGSGWQELTLQAGTGVPSLAGAVAGARRAAGQCSLLLETRLPGMAGPWDGCQEAAGSAMAGQRSQYLLWLPGEGSATLLLPSTRSSSPVPERSPWLLCCPSSVAGTLERAGPTHEREMSSPTPCQEYLPAGCVRPWARQVLGHGRFYIGCFSGMGPQMCIQPSPAPSPPVPACSGAPSALADLQEDLEGVWLLQEIKLLPPSLGSEGAWGGGEGTPRHIQGPPMPVNQSQSRQVLCCSCFPTHVTFPVCGLCPRTAGRNG